MPELDLKPTAEMAANAARGLELREKYGKGGTAVGVARARDIKNRANLSPSTVKRMHSFFSRHEGNQKGGEDDAGYIAWLLWGGDAGKAWAARKSEQIDKSESARFSHDIRLPKGKRRLNIDEAHAALAQMGYKLGTVRYDPAAGGSVYKVTQPNGSVIDMPAAKLTDFIYEKAKHMKSGTKAAFATDAEIKKRSPLSRFVVDYIKLLKWSDGEVQRIPQQLHFATYEAAQDWIATVERKGWFKGFGGNMEKVEHSTIRPLRASRAGAKAAFSESAAWIAKYLPALNQWWRDRTDHPTDLDASSDRWEIEGVLDDVAEHCREAVPREAKPSWYAAALRDVKKIPHSKNANRKTNMAVMLLGVEDTKRLKEKLHNAEYNYKEAVDWLNSLLSTARARPNDVTPQSLQRAREKVTKTSQELAGWRSMAQRHMVNFSRAGAKAAFSESAAWIAKYLPALNQWWRDRTDHPTDLDASSDRWEIEGVLDDVAEHCREAVPREAKPSWYAAALRDVKKIPHARKVSMKSHFAVKKSVSGTLVTLVPKAKGAGWKSYYAEWSSAKDARVTHHGVLVERDDGRVTLTHTSGQVVSEGNAGFGSMSAIRMSRAGAKSTHATDNMYYTVAAHIGDQPAGERTTKSLDEAKAYAKSMLAALKPNAKGKPLVVDVYPVVNYSPQAPVLSLKASRAGAKSDGLTLAQRIAVEHDAKRMANR